MISRSARSSSIGRLQRVRELGGGLEPLATALAEPVGARVLDDEAGGAWPAPPTSCSSGVGERRAAVLLGQVQVAEDGAADPDGTPRNVVIGGWWAGNP